MNFRKRSRLALATWLAICLCQLQANFGLAAEPTRPARTVDFAKDIFPILRRSCFECHGAEKQEGGLRLDQRDEFIEGGSVVPGQAERSELLRRIVLPRDHDEVMPAIGEPLSPKQVDLFRNWISDGANWPQDFQEQRHWAYVSPTRTELPALQDLAWPRNPIDRFVLARLEQEELRPAAEATSAKLIRRLHLDLIGLPPTPEEVNQFVEDPTAERYEAVVDQLLARPQYGERWARPWLDLARYADSHGFQRDNLRDIWAYRDWVIRALNEDMPFDQFTVEQLAGDLLPNATEAQRIATGFHRCTPTNVEAGSLPEETRIEQVIDRVNTTGAVWLGTTLECCQCHDHKYDPFTTQEYYQLLAFYNNTEMEADRANAKSPSSIKFNGPFMPLANAERDRKRSELERELKTLNDQRANRSAELDSDLETWQQQLRVTMAETPVNHLLDVQEFTSLGTGDTFEKLADGSILLTGEAPPANDTYRLTVRGELSGIRGFRLDALRHDGIPGMGPGRGDPVKRNFVLNEFTVHVEAINPEAINPEATKAGTEEAGRKLEFVSARASFSQANWDVSGALKSDAKNRTGWAISPKFAEPHWADFILAEPIDLDPDSQLVFTLKQNWGQSRTIGCLKLSGITGNVNAASYPAGLAKVVQKKIDKWTKKERGIAVDYRLAQDPEAKRLDQLITALAEQVTKLAADTTLVMLEMKVPRDSTVFERGDYRNPGDPVQANVPDVLNPLPAGPKSRLTLARWLVDPENPLVARVTVNRLWGELFGQGLVTTPEDFGLKGEPPSHPQLLDWLAMEFVERGWSTKGLLKTIVMSSTYRQSSNVNPTLWERDPKNSLLARGPRYRLDAEMIRDNALSISGLLSLKQFGPSIQPYQPPGIWSKVGGTAYKYKTSPGEEQYRRGIYVVIKRGSPYPSFVNFDAPARLTCTVTRSRTNTALQALTLLNDRVYVEAAKALAQRVLRDKPNEKLESQLSYAFQLCTARNPSDNELATLRSLFLAQRESAKQTQPAGESDSNVVSSKADAGATPGAMAKSGVTDDAWYSVATVLLNLHETITKD